LEYHKIENIFNRDMESKEKKLIEGDFKREEFQYLQANNWVWTEKVDGTNIRIMLNDGQLQYGGRTDRASIPTNLLIYLSQTLGPQLDTMKKMFSEGVCLYGEGYGKKIQKGGHLYSDTQKFVLFDARIGSWWLKREDVCNIAESLTLDIVPMVGIGTLWEAVHKVKDGLKSSWGDFPAEGIVARPAVEVKNRDGSRIITKIKCRDF